jgi:hypothetical protein
LLLGLPQFLACLTHQLAQKLAAPMRRLKKLKFLNKGIGRPGI